MNNKEMEDTTVNFPMRNTRLSQAVKASMTTDPLPVESSLHRQDSFDNTVNSFVNVDNKSVAGRGQQSGKSSKQG